MTHDQQRVLITAAASGIGLLMADAFVAAGAQVFICDSDATTLAATLASRPALAGQVCDVSDEHQVSALFAAATAHLKGLDILVSNAGIAGPTASGKSARAVAEARRWRPAAACTAAEGPRVTRARAVW
jgi:NAD(P)-dependent dehydrogenase (short-subunit alcohol dehydrogenase family)